ncbi:hypothetical protein FA95DRAFT_1578095 [Auriscalpium vulgare]|uniref:Uncharacterized protein n=1 Tax=Auriscalpium vulgare TaxID=40419 RepID=A0ACB8R4S9_9AGAM|nr:hypothetical protein FA95DRAFT_1578095 [Auriscalpium vulgare]
MSSFAPILLDKTLSLVKECIGALLTTPVNGYTVFAASWEAAMHPGESVPTETDTEGELNELDETEELEDEPEPVAQRTRRSAEPPLISRKARARRAAASINLRRWSTWVPPHGYLRSAPQDIGAGPEKAGAVVCRQHEPATSQMSAGKPHTKRPSNPWRGLGKQMEEQGSSNGGARPRSTAPANPVQPSSFCASPVHTVPVVVRGNVDVELAVPTGDGVSIERCDDLLAIAVQPLCGGVGVSVTLAVPANHGVSLQPRGDSVVIAAWAARRATGDARALSASGVGMGPHARRTTRTAPAVQRAGQDVLRAGAAERVRRGAWVTTRAAGVTRFAVVASVLVQQAARVLGASFLALYINGSLQHEKGMKVFGIERITVNQIYLPV